VAGEIVLTEHASETRRRPIGRRSFLSSCRSRRKEAPSHRRAPSKSDPLVLFVLRRMQNIRNQISEIRIGHLFQTFWHDGEFADSARRDIRFRDDIFLWPG